MGLTCCWGWGGGVFRLVPALFRLKGGGVSGLLNKVIRRTKFLRRWGGGGGGGKREIAQWLERRTRDRKGCGFESLLERRENFLLQGQLSVLTLISVSVPPPCYRSST